jgi:hypothetical protein
VALSWELHSHDRLLLWGQPTASPEDREGKEAHDPRLIYFDDPDGNRGLCQDLACFLLLLARPQRLHRCNPLFHLPR